MAQDHCAIPYFAGKETSNVLLKQKIVGAKQHGLSKSFYRAMSHIQTGTNLAIEVLVQEIIYRLEHCIATDTTFPRWLHLQIDGGPENTAKEFYAFCEFLVRDNVFDHIEVSRLPVGHTHEDIDAMFGVLWRAAQGKTIVTPQQWQEMALNAFKEDL